MTKDYTMYYKDFLSHVGYTNSDVPVLQIKKVIFNDPATIVIWNDGTKTVVKCCEDDEFDPEKGLAMAISKKALGDSLKEVRKWTDEYYKDLDSLNTGSFGDLDSLNTGSFGDFVRALNKLFK